MSQSLSSSSLPFLCRKRVRSNNCEEECCDFMPLSKRINNLHINNATCCNGLGHPVTEHSSYKQDHPFDDCQSGDVTLLGHSSEPLDLPYSSLSRSAMHSGLKHYDLHQGENSNESTAVVHNWMNDHVLSLYSPDLNANDNPYYYENNKLLFALYMERMQRGGHDIY